jgi:hypothetical protein
VVDSLKTLDPNRPIREADISCRPDCTSEPNVISPTSRHVRSRVGHRA